MESLRDVLSMPVEEMKRRIRNEKEVDALVDVAGKASEMDDRVNEYETLCLEASKLQEDWKELWSDGKDSNSSSILEVAKKISQNNRKREEILLRIDEITYEIESLASLVETYSQANASIAEELEQSGGSQGYLAKEKRFLGDCEREIVARVTMILSGNVQGLEKFADWMSQRRDSWSSDRLASGEPARRNAGRLSGQIHSSDKDSNSPKNGRKDGNDTKRTLGHDYRGKSHGNPPNLHPGIPSTHAELPSPPERACFDAHKNTLLAKHIGETSSLKEAELNEKSEDQDAVGSSDQEQSRGKVLQDSSCRKKARTEKISVSREKKGYAVEFQDHCAQGNDLTLRLSGSAGSDSPLPINAFHDQTDDGEASQEPQKMGFTPTTGGQAPECTANAFNTPMCVADAAVGATARILHSASTKGAEKSSSQPFILDGGSTVKKLVQSQ